MKFTIRIAKQSDKDEILRLLDEFREDCIFQITGEEGHSDSAVKHGENLFEVLLTLQDYGIFVAVDEENTIVGIITGYLCPMLRSGSYRAEIEEFFVKSGYRGKGIANELMDAFFDWCNEKGVKKVNLESDNELLRAHGFYKKYGFETKAQRFVKKI
ncbi:MAG: GNAT family N-acetyltransferase [Microgenomates group bacterium]